MARYTLGTDIPIVWTLDTRGLSGSLASYNLYFEYYTGTGRKRVSGFTIDGSVLSWTFPGSEQIAYGQYGLRLVVADSHQGTIAEYKLDNAFELIHGTPSQQAEPQRFSSSLEIDATEEADEPQSDNYEPAQYASPSPLYLEKIPLGSNIVLNWNLLTAGDFDFDLAECDIKLYYSASGSGRREAEDYELLTENGYVLQWRFAGVEQIRYGLYSLFLEVYQGELLIAVLEREYAFELTHRNGSDILVDRIISFESYVTSLGGGALFSLYDVLNNGHSTVYRGDGITPAAAGDLLIFGGNKWNAIPAGGIGAIQALGEGLASLQFDVNGLVVRVGDTEGNLSTLTQRADSIELRVSDAEGNIGDLELTSTALAARMSNAEGDLAVLELTAGSLTTRISNAEGDIGSLELTASSLTTRISNAEGDVSSLQQTATSLTSRMSNAEGDISVLTQTATGLQYQVNSQYGDIATLKVTARGLTSRVSNAEGDISVLEQTATSLTSRITDAEGDISTLTQTANRIELAVQAVDSEVTRYEGVTDAALASMQDQIDGVIETWYYNGVPTLNNLPASQWTTVDEKNNHIGDLYYDKDTGKAYRFMLDSTENPAVYKWVELADEDIAKALALAGEKKRVFVVTPFAPYDVGDLWVRSRSVGSDTTSEIWRCKTSRAADASPGFLESEWESADNYGYVVNKSNLEVLSDAIVGQVGTYTYNADGTLTSSAASTIAQTATSIRLATVVDNVALAGITIDATNHTGSVTIFSDNFFIKDGSHTKTALAITHDSQGNSLIDVTSLNVAGIFTTSAWLTEETALHGYADTAAGTAETNAKDYANSQAYLTGYVVPLINSATAGLAVDSDYSYLKTALENQTTALGGLMLTSLIQLGASQSGSTWSVHSGISGIYDTTKLGNGIAAWFGGPMTDWKTLSAAERLTTPYAKSLFRMDGSGYLASGEIQWGTSGEIILHGTSIEAAEIDGDTTFTYDGQTFTVADLLVLKSLFTVEEYDTTNHKYRLKLAASTGGTGIDGFYVQGAIWSDGDQIVGSGTPGGGGGGGVDNLYKLEDVYGNFTTGRVKTATGADVSDGQALVWSGTLSKWVAGTVQSGETYYRDFGITLNNNAFSVAHDVAAYADEQTITFDPDSHSGVMAENPVEWGAAITYGVNLMVNNTTKGLALASSIVDLWTAVNGKQPAGNYLTSVPLATDSLIGGFQTGFTQSGKNYPVQLSSNKAYVNVPWTDTTYSIATTSTAGLMSAADKTKLNGIAEGANNYTLPTASSSVLGGIKIGTGLTIDSNGVVSVTGQTSGTVTQVKVGSTAYNPDTSGIVSLPAYPTVPTNVSAFTNDAGYITSYINTWRNVYTGGTSRVGTGTDTKAINFAAGSNVTITYEAAGTGSGQSGSANYYNVKIAASMAFSNLTSHPSTIAGYGITDAKIENGVITLGSNTITPLTAHQTIYNLVIYNSAGTAQLTYKPATSGTYTLTLTKDMVGLGNVPNWAVTSIDSTTQNFVN